MDRISFEQLDKLTEGQDKTVARMIERTVYAINTTEESLARKLEYVADTVSRLQQTLTEGNQASGGLGSAPAEIDQLIGARTIHWQNLGGLIGVEAANALATSKA